MKEPQINSTTKTAMRAYGPMELASLYSPYTTPRHAWRKFQEWIESHPTLSHDLAETGYDGHQRTFTPRRYILYSAPSACRNGTENTSLRLKYGEPNSSKLKK